MVFNLVVASNTFLQWFCLFFLIIDLTVLISAVITQVFNPTVENAILVGLPTNDAKEETETHPVILDSKISKYTM